MLFKENREKKKPDRAIDAHKKTADRTFLLGIQWKSLHIEVIKKPLGVQATHNLRETIDRGKKKR